jgi:hypothetical protein
VAFGDASQQCCADWQQLGRRDQSGFWDTEPKWNTLRRSNRRSYLIGRGHAFRCRDRIIGICWHTDHHSRACLQLVFLSFRLLNTYDSGPREERECMFQSIVLARQSSELSKLALTLRDKEYSWECVLMELRLAAELGSP